MEVFLQIWGGVFFLLNKVFFCFMERNIQFIWGYTIPWKILSWIVFLVGVPAWIILFVADHKWIAAALEAGGIPGIILGLVIAIKGRGREPKWLDLLTIISIVTGLGISIYDFNGLTQVSQYAELLMTTGFLIGTYKIAKGKLSGYLWYIPMHLSCIWLMYLQDLPWLILQQAASIPFVLDAFFVKKAKSRYGSQ